MERVLRPTAMILGILCLVVFFSFSYEHQALPDRETETWSVGLNLAPWYKFEKETFHGPQKRGFEAHGGVKWLSWSWLFLLAGLPLLRYGLRGSRPHTPAANP